MKKWLHEIQQLSFSLEEFRAFPIPDVVPNTIWGCMVIVDRELDGRDVGKHELCQRVSSTFYIPEKSIVSPFLTESDKTTLFTNSIHVLHPEFGLVELDLNFDVADLLLDPKEQFQHIIQPEDAAFVPKAIRSFQIKPVVPEKILEALEESFPKKEPLPDDSLTPIEKAKLTLYKAIFQKQRDMSTKGSRLTNLGKKLESLLTTNSNKENKWLRRLEEDFDDLAKRNQKQLDKLLDLLRENPAEALKYAIPLDTTGTSRGDNQGALHLLKRWNSFSLFGANSQYGERDGGNVILEEGFHRLNEQYEQTARDLIAQHEYKKAAFVYIRLLKNYYMAASTLEKGGMYQEAATIYLKHLDDQAKAAVCYEKANMTLEAIPIYEELEQFSKVGDLYMKLHNRHAAIRFYEKEAQVSISNRKYIAASNIYLEKIGDQQEAQRLLMVGWESDSNAYDCLNRYLANISDTEILKKE